MKGLRSTDRAVHAQDAKAARMLNFRKEFQLAEGLVIIQALPIPLIDQTTELLASSFVASITHLAPYASYVRRNIARYLREHQAMAPDALILVAVLQPCVTEPAVAGEAAVAEAPDAAAVQANSTDVVSAGDASGMHHQSSTSASTLSGTRLRVIGSAEVSFKSSTRSSQPFLDAPEVGTHALLALSRHLLQLRATSTLISIHAIQIQLRLLHNVHMCCYMCNMAVSTVFRRRGVATRLLAAAEELAADVMKESEMYLHLRFVDKEAAALYERAGYRAQAQHWPIAPIFGIQRMKLMRKDLRR
ncbi:hypothetical protein VOLCADRAFT_90366 [Volvox carteri f. nagariensis]|uniref:N-acetyltransferase domain-containing protein n=1 Tax=Volvox carteri f. nagariensis TaxID=3068 RepID=D8TU66_VOLCA|nr:uncharacterized protein VOLCADRAFT_90366 [Volvox carteri f. nagariensis]EFJ49091.1 hypothetical protein VOLCADRAFT_90366 [Volvox carteri f. nagariensis]|eukprot:XP_002949988.1 hypothetical protein VOLCADRAFT_90366 [Volvox carteri f. nagariensis]